MAKRLTLVLTLALALGMCGAAYAEVQNVKVSGDITVFGVYQNIDFQDHKYGTDGVDKELASIARVRVDADLTDNVMTTVRLLNERFWGDETNNTPYVGADDSPNTNISLDLAYVTLKEFLYSPLTLTVGRQELMFGNGMIVGDPDTNGQVSTASAFAQNHGLAALSARKSFDAIRATLNYDPLVVDIVAAKLDEATLNLQDDGDLYGINANYQLDKKTTLEGYYWRGWDESKTTGEPTKTNLVNVIGGRIAFIPVEDMLLSLESAYQFGRYYDSGVPGGCDRSAWALEAGASQIWTKKKYAPGLALGYAYFSGEADDFDPTCDNTFNAWDPMLENQKYGDIMNQIMPQSNAHIIVAQGSLKPADDIMLKGEYYAFWVAKRYPDGLTNVADLRGDNIVARREKFVGHELDLTASYDYTEDVQFSVLAGWFFPGPVFSNENRNTASELVGTMKVTF